MIVRARETNRRRFARVERTAKVKHAVRYSQSTCGLAATTPASHAQGRQFDPGQVYGSWQNASVNGRAHYLCKNPRAFLCIENGRARSVFAFWKQTLEVMGIPTAIMRRVASDLWWPRRSGRVKDFQPKALRQVWKSQPTIRIACFALRHAFETLLLGSRAWLARAHC